VKSGKADQGGSTVKRWSAPDGAIACRSQRDGAHRTERSLAVRKEMERTGRRERRPFVKRKSAPDVAIAGRS